MSRDVPDPSRGRHTRTKFDLINELAGLYAFRRYLEICSPTTGGRYRYVDRTRLTCHRLMYLCPDAFSDGLAIDFRSADRDFSSCLQDMHSRGLRYDIILVDPWHEYETSLRDIREAFAFLDTGGMLIVHDCLPPKKEIATPQFKAGSWCGVTYKAFLDFVLSQTGLDYRTVDIDYGCGVIRKLAGVARWQERLARSFGGPWCGRASAPLRRQWLKLGDDFESAYDIFEANKRTLLRLQTPDEFFQTLPIGPAALMK
jgi:hypothetical protein